MSRAKRPGSAQAPEPGRDQEIEAFELLGLARRAGFVSLGVDRARRAIRSGEACLLLTAADGSPVQLKKVRRPARKMETKERVLGDRDSLGRAVGAPPISAVVITDAGFAEQLLHRLPTPEGDVGGSS